MIEKPVGYQNPQFFSLVTLLLVLLQSGAILAAKNLLPEKVPLFYTRPWGEEQLAPNHFLFLLPAVSFLVLMLNMLLQRLLFKRGEVALSWIILSSGLLFSILATFTLLKIIFLIT